MSVNVDDDISRVIGGVIGEVIGGGGLYVVFIRGERGVRMVYLCLCVVFLS